MIVGGDSQAYHENDMGQAKTGLENRIHKVASEQSAAKEILIAEEHPLVNHSLQ